LHGESLITLAALRHGSIPFAALMRLIVVNTIAVHKPAAIAETELQPPLGFD
jgi:hypothetical protein